MEHNLISVGKVHPVHNWRVANTAARLALSVTSNDLGKYCWQLDDNSQWFLSGVGPTVWAPVGNAQSLPTFSPVAFSPVAGTTTLTVSGGYNPGLIFVEKNGALLSTNDFIALNGTTILVDATTSGDTFTVYVFNTVSFANAVSNTAFVNALALKANIESPNFTGTVTGITKAMVGLDQVDNTSNVTERAATATLTNKTINLTSNTLSMTALQLFTAVATKTGTGNPVFSIAPTFTGVPAAPTAAVANNTTQIATTAFTQAALAAWGVGVTTPTTLADGNSASATGFVRLTGSSTNTPVAATGVPLLTMQYGAGFASQIAVGLGSNKFYWRSQDTTVWNAWKEGASVDSPSFTGIPTAPTASSITNSTQIATTAFVVAANSATGLPISANPVASDINQTPNSGFFRITSSGTNGPFAATPFAYIHANYNSTNTSGYQLGGDPGGIDAYFRTFNASVFASWRRLVFYDTTGTLTGTLNVNTQAAANVSQRIANTAFVDTEMTTTAKVMSAKTLVASQALAVAQISQGNTSQIAVNGASTSTVNTAQLPAFYVGGQGGGCNIHMYSHNATSAFLGGRITGARALGNLGALTALTAGRVALSIAGAGYDGAAYQTMGDLNIESVGTITGSDSQGLWRLRAVPTGTVVPTDVWTATATAFAVLVAQSGTNAAWSGPIRPGQYTLATLPSAATFNGYIITVTDATGGAKVCRSNGTVWQILNTTTTVT